MIQASFLAITTCTMYYCNLNVITIINLVHVTCTNLDLAINTQLMRFETLYNTFYSKIHPFNPLKGIPERKKAISQMRNRNPSPASSIPCYILYGMAVHSDFQGFGIGTLLVQWGLDKAKEDGLPVFTGGEERGVLFYTNALGFKRIPETEYWLDKDGKEITREEVQKGNIAWKKSFGGVSGSDLVWYPESMSKSMLVKN